jgi:hypothetical protein
MWVSFGRSRPDGHFQIAIVADRAQRVATAWPLHSAHTPGLDSRHRAEVEERVDVLLLPSFTRSRSAPRPLSHSQSRGGRRRHHTIAPSN